MRAFAGFHYDTSAVTSPASPTLRRAAPAGRATALPKRPPSLDRLLRTPSVSGLVDAHGRAPVVAELREILHGLRASLRNAGRSAETPGDTGCAPESSRAEDEAIAAELARRLALRAEPSMREVFNLTGTVLHTNLGRALLPREAAEAAARALMRACNLEYDLDEGTRGERDTHVEALLCGLTGAGAATVVNNNAAAVFLVLNTLASGKSVPVSRGELIEIGGSFRIPEIMERSGARLREVGTTNRTHLHDYEQAIDADTGLLMKVHTSNYAIVGYTAAPEERELAALARRRGLPCVVDLGSGTLADLARWGLPAEPTPRQALAAGADLVTFSADKLLGGPQAGIVVGRRELVERLRRNPLKRVLRIDKARLAALEAVLQLYRDPDSLPSRLPTLRMLLRTRDEIRATAERLLPVLRAWVADDARVEVRECASQIGSGSLPIDRLPSAALRISPTAPKRYAPAALAGIAERLRSLPIPVIGRMHGGALWLDLRCLTDEERLVEQFSRQPRGDAPRAP